jgi:hypothetical protein
MLRRRGSRWPSRQDAGKVKGPVLLDDLYALLSHHFLFSDIR